MCERTVLQAIHDAVLSFFVHRRLDPRGRPRRQHDVQLQSRDAIARSATPKVLGLSGTSSKWLIRLSQTRLRVRHSGTGLTVPARFAIIWISASMHMYTAKQAKTTHNIHTPRFPERAAKAKRAQGRIRKIVPTTVLLLLHLKSLRTISRFTGCEHAYIRYLFTRTDAIKIELVASPSPRQ